MNLTNEITKRLKVFGLKNNEINHFFTTKQIPCINIHAEKKELPSVILVATNILAKENNITVNELKEKNNLTTNLLSIGQTIIIP